MREAFPDHVEYFEEWRCSSEEARKDVEPALDVSYGKGEREKLDIFPGDRAVGAVFIFIHGGYWRTMDKSDFSFLARPFVSRGVTVVIPNYPFSPAAAIGEIVTATRRMLHWVFENIGTYGGDSGQVHVSGWSAGAHLTAMLLTASSATAERWPRSALAISGIYDLRPIRHLRANEDLRITQSAAVTNSPVLLKPAHRTRLAIAMGSLETSAIHDQARSLVSAWGPELGGGLSSRSIAKAHHYSVVSRLGDESNELFRLALELIGAAKRGQAQRQPGVPKEML
jgi:arylformamidase